MNLQIIETKKCNRYSYYFTDNDDENVIHYILKINDTEPYEHVLYKIANDKMEHVVDVDVINYFLTFINKG